MLKLLSVICYLKLFRFGIWKFELKILEEEFHRPVLLEEAVEFLQVKPYGVYVDCTLGGGGYAQEILKRGGKLIGFDLDPEAIKETLKQLKTLKLLRERKDYWLFNENFANLKEVIGGIGFEKVDGVVFDLGVSRHELTDKNRGFSFLQDSRLDMRMDPRSKISALDLVNALTEKEFYVLFTKYGEERLAKPIARSIIRTRGMRPIERTEELAQIVSDVYAGFGLKTRIHPATRVFQALRIAVNNELENLEIALEGTLSILKNGGRLVVVSFHSLEDRITKDFFRKGEEEGSLKVLTKKPILASSEELRENLSARSAKLRVAEKLTV